MECSLLWNKHLSFAGARSQMNTTLYQNRPEDTQNWTNLYLEPHDYRIYYVNIDLRHQYGISVAESQTFLRAKRPQGGRARRNGCFRRLKTRTMLLSTSQMSHVRSLYKNRPEITVSDYTLKYVLNVSQSFLVSIFSSILIRISSLSSVQELLRNNTNNKKSFRLRKHLVKSLVLSSVC